jgi:hypothetical protein
MSAVWRNTTIAWKDPNSWTTALSRWIRPFLNGRGIRHLQRMGEQDLCSDDPEWLKKTQQILRHDVGYIVESLSDALSFATARTYHGCRAEDVGSYLRAGILRNDPGALAQEVRRIVRDDDRLAFLRPVIEQRLEEFDSKDRDTGKLYVVMDDRGLTDGAGHYLLYGSEWMQCILGWEAHEALLRRGFPTIFTVDLPLSMAHSHDREQLAEVLLLEWTRIRVNRPNWVPDLDFTFFLREDIPGTMIVGHRHPEKVRDPFHNVTRRVERRMCPDCAP